MNSKDVCPIHGESSQERLQEVLSRLSDEDLNVLADSQPHNLFSAISTVAGTRTLAKMRELKAETWAPA